MSVFLTDRALSDIQRIYDYSIHEWGKPTAEKYLDGIEGAIQRLEQHPELLIQKPHISEHFYVYQSQKHWLICDRFGESIYLLTVQHMGMNLLDHLNEMEPTLTQEMRVLHDFIEKP